MILLEWWLLFCSSVTGLALCWQFGLLDALQRADQSYLGFVCVAVYFLSCLRAGWLTAMAQKGHHIAESLPFMWLVSETLLAIGLLGTLIGFMLGGAGFADLNPENVAQTQRALGVMAQGMSTAVVTTLVGLITSVLLKFQLVAIES